MNTLGIGVIGCGIIASVHLDAIKKAENAKLVAVCDIIEERAKNLAEKYECDYSNSYKELIDRDDIDLIHILTPHHTHYKIASDVINGNKHCLVEKPMTISTNDAKALIKQLKDKPAIKCGIVFQNRLNTTSQMIRKIIDEKTYGELKGIRGNVTWLRDKNYYEHDKWRGKWATEGGGVLINQAIHTIDLIQWFGGEIEAISGNYGTYRLQDVIEVEDTATLFIKFKNGVSGLLFATNNNSINTPIELEIVFEKAVLLLTDKELLLKKDGCTTKLTSDQQLNGVKAYWGLSHEKLIHNFYKSILNNETNYVSPNEAAQTIEILEKFYRYANNGNSIIIENTLVW